ncbi:MAG: biopolymer transporter ExbD [Planctomycetota bacterium]
MKFAKKDQNEILEGDLTPMIDMVFQLIAFFMLLLNFSEVDRAEEITLPTSVLAVPPEVRPEYQIILNLEPSGALKFAGQPIPRIDLLGSILTKEINAASREDVNDPADIAVIIRSHQDTPTGMVQELIAKCQESELQSFSLRVKEKVGGS